MEVSPHFRTEIIGQHWGQEPGVASSTPTGFELELVVTNLDLSGQFNFGFGPWFRGENNNKPSGLGGYSRSGLAVNYMLDGHQVYDVPYNLEALNVASNEWVGLMGGGTIPLKAGDRVRFRAYYSFPENAVQIQFRLPGKLWSIPDREVAHRNAVKLEEVQTKIANARKQLAKASLISIDSLIGIEKFQEARERLDLISEELPDHAVQVNVLRAKVDSASVFAMKQHRLVEITSIDRTDTINLVGRVQRLREFLKSEDAMDSTERQILHSLAAKLYASVGKRRAADREFASAASAYNTALLYEPNNRILTELKNSQPIPYRSPTFAGLASSVLPGSGLIWTGHTITGPLALAAVAGCALWANSQYPSYARIRDSVAALGRNAYGGDQQLVNQARESFIGPIALGVAIYLYQIYAAVQGAENYNSTARDDHSFRALFTLKEDPLSRNFALGLEIHLGTH